MIPKSKIFYKTGSRYPAAPSKVISKTGRPPQGPAGRVGKKMNKSGCELKTRKNRQDDGEHAFQKH
jgi:hypothetical protein